MTTIREITDEEVLTRYPDLAIDHLNKNFWKGCLQKKLLINRCQNCGNYIHLPRPMCPVCWSENVVPTEVSGKGTLFLFSLLHQEGPGTPDNPYPVIVVELAEQQRLRMTSTIVNCSKSDIRIGIAVEVVWIDRKGAPIPAFQPVLTSTRG